MWWVSALQYVLFLLGKAFMNVSDATFWLAKQTLRGIKKLNEFFDEAQDA